MRVLSYVHLWKKVIQILQRKCNNKHLMRLHCVVIYLSLFCSHQWQYYSNTSLVNIIFFNLKITFFQDSLYFHRIELFYFALQKIFIKDIMKKWDISVTWHTYILHIMDRVSIILTISGILFDEKYITIILSEKISFEFLYWLEITVKLLW